MFGSKDHPIGGPTATWGWNPKFNQTEPLPLLRCVVVCPLTLSRVGGEAAGLGQLATSPRHVRRTINRSNPRCRGTRRDPELTGIRVGQPLARNPSKPMSRATSLASSRLLLRRPAVIRRPTIAGTTSHNHSGRCIKKFETQISQSKAQI